MTAAKQIKISIPVGLDFSALKLCRDSKTGAVEFEREPIDRVCAASQIDSNIFFCNEDSIGSLIVAWYAEHRRCGGLPDAVAEDLITEIFAEDARGGAISHQPGRA